MDFTDHALNELRDIYRDVFDEEITLDQARQMGLQLVHLYEQVARRVPSQGDAEDTPHPLPPGQGGELGHPESLLN